MQMSRNNAWHWISSVDLLLTLFTVLKLAAVDLVSRRLKCDKNRRGESPLLFLAQDLLVCGICCGDSGLA